MNISLKGSYGFLVLLAVLSIPYIEYGVFPYNVDLFAYAIGFLVVPLIAGGISRISRGAEGGSFLLGFNVIGTLMFMGVVANILNGG